MGRTTPVSSLCLQRSPTSLHGLLPFQVDLRSTGPRPTRHPTRNMGVKSEECCLLAPRIPTRPRQDELRTLTRVAENDRTARSREFHPGDQVLVLLPTSTNKLLAEWQGPYPITKRIGKVNYEIKMTDRRKQKRVFHITLLRAWHAPTAVCYWSEAASDEGDDPITYFEPSCDGEPTFGDSLSPAQLTDLRRNSILSSVAPQDVRPSWNTESPQDKPSPYAFLNIGFLMPTDRQSARNLGKWRRKGSSKGLTANGLHRSS